MRLRFQLLNTPLKGLQFDTDAHEVSIGRSAHSDLVLKLPSVSRHHALVRVRGGKATIEDADSRNETRLDGEPVHGPMALSDGCVVSLGEAMLAVSFPESQASEPDEEETEVTPQSGTAVGGVPMPGAAAPTPSPPQSWFEASSAPPAPAEPAPVPARAEAAVGLEKRIWPALSLLLGLAAGAVLMLFFLGRFSSPRGAQGTFGAYVHLGDRKLIEVPRGFVYRPKVDDEGTVTVSVPGPVRRLERAVALEGKSTGLADVRLHDATGKRFVLLHVLVLPPRPDELAPLLQYQELPPDQKRKVADRHMLLGSVAAQEGKLVEARDELRLAKALYAGMADHLALSRAIDSLEAVEKRIEDQYNRMLLDMGLQVKDGDMRMAAVKLAQMQQFLTDQTDIRRQNVDLLLRILSKAIEQEKSRY